MRCANTLFVRTLVAIAVLGLSLIKALAAPAEKVNVNVRIVHSLDGQNIGADAPLLLYLLDGKGGMRTSEGVPVKLDEDVSGLFKPMKDVKKHYVVIDITDPERTTITMAIKAINRFRNSIPKDVEVDIFIRTKREGK